jgi:hypothetical protein
LQFQKDARYKRACVVGAGKSIDEKWCLTQVPQKEPQNTIFLGNERLKSRIHTREGWLMGVE